MWTAHKLVLFYYRRLSFLFFSFLFFKNQFKIMGVGNPFPPLRMCPPSLSSLLLCQKFLFFLFLFFFCWPSSIHWWETKLHSKLSREEERVFVEFSGVVCLVFCLLDLHYFWSVCGASVSVFSFILPIISPVACPLQSPRVPSPHIH